MRPRTPSGSPWPARRFQLVPPSIDFQRPLPGPPEVRLHGERTTCQVAAKSTFGLRGSNTTSIAPVDGATPSASLTGVHSMPPSALLNTPPATPPNQYVAGSPGTPATAIDRPPRKGPIARHFMPE